jgi:hypothetical protein
MIVTKRVPALVLRRFKADPTKATVRVDYVGEVAADMKSGVEVGESCLIDLDFDTETHTYTRAEEPAETTLSERFHLAWYNRDQRLFDRCVAEIQSVTQSRSPDVAP